jgi:tetratricopeptide (TPR) repeat protein
MVIAEKKSSNYTKAVSKAADLELGSKNYQKAIQNYKILSSNATDKKELVKAWTGLSESFYQTSKYDSALVYTKEIINAGSINLGAQNSALLLQGKIFEAKGDNIRAVEEYNKCMKTVKDNIGAEAKYLVCNLQLKQKKFEECKKECLDFSNSFPDSDLWRGRAFLVYAEACLATNDKLQAKATLESLIENSEDKETIELAKEKLKKLQ